MLPAMMDVIKIMMDVIKIFRDRGGREEEEEEDDEEVGDVVVVPIDVAHRGPTTQSDPLGLPCHKTGSEPRRKHFNGKIQWAPDRVF